MAIIHDDRTPHDDLALPHPDNDQEDDVLRLRGAMLAVDAALEAIRTAMAGGLSTASDNLAALALDFEASEQALSLGLTTIDGALSAHKNRSDNPHGTTKAHVGLGNVDNTSDANKNAAAVTLTNKTVQGGVYTGAVDQTGSVRGGIVDMAAGTAADCSLGNYFIKTINGAFSPTFTNAPAARAYAFVLVLTHTSGTISWPATVKWPGDLAPQLTTGKTHVFVFLTSDGGATRWRGVYIPNYVT